MLLIIGLGNPGKEYALTRHNVGWLVIDELAKQEGLDWKLQKKLQAEIAKNSEMILAKPQTFMNLSGQAARSIIGNWKLSARGGSALGGEIGNLVVVHDEVDLPFGTIRVSHNASSAGHKGVQSIIDHFGTKEFWRIRIGIKSVNSEQEAGNRKIDTPEYVLKKFTAEEKKKLPIIIEKTLTIVEEFRNNKETVKTVHVP